LGKVLGLVEKRYALLIEYFGAVRFINPRFFVLSMSDKEKTTPEIKKPLKPAPAQAVKPVEFKKIIRIADADIDGAQRFEHALSHIRGVSWAYAHAIRNALNLPNKKLADFSEEELNKVKECLMNPHKYGLPVWMYNRRKDINTGRDMHLLSSDLVLAGKMDVKFLKTIRTYRGVRHSFNYKVRGQRTRSKGANVRGRVGGTVVFVKRKLAPGAAAKGKEEKK
jgi:small subunit ribosomal protein S13